MKNSILSNTKFFANKGKKPRTPLRTFTEMAKEFGITTVELRVALTHSKVTPPSPLLKHYKPKTGSGKGNTWYNPVQLRQWWAQHSESISNTTNHTHKEYHCE